MKRRLLSLFALVAAAAAGFLAGAAWDSPRVARDGDPAALVRSALDQPDRLERARVLVSVLDEIGPAQLDAVVEVVEQDLAAGRLDAGALDLLAEAWAEVDPDAAYERISGHWPPNARILGLESLLRAWGRRDPAAAWAAFDRIADPMARKPAQTALIQGWAEGGESADAWNLVAQLPAGGVREEASMVLMADFAHRRGLPALLEKVESLPDDAPERFKLHAFRTAVSHVARVDPALAVAFADRHAGGPFATGLVRRVAVNWVAMEPVPALEWVIAKPPQQERDGALREAFRRWLVRDRGAALAWLEARLPEDAEVGRLLPLYDLYATARARGDLPGAAAWAEQIRDTDARQEAMLDVGLLWLQRDRARGREWLEQHGLYEALEARLAARGRSLERQGLGAPALD